MTHYCQKKLVDYQQQGGSQSHKKVDKAEENINLRSFFSHFKKRKFFNFLYFFVKILRSIILHENFFQISLPKILVPKSSTFSNISILVSAFTDALKDSKSYNYNNFVYD